MAIDPDLAVVLAGLAIVSVTVISLAKPIEHAIDSIALETERISEGQRFTTKLLAEAPRTSATAPRPPGG